MSNGNDMAFPVLDRTQTPNDTYQLGLTKREYFAAMAMQAVVANPRFAESVSEQQVAAWATHQADALLAELSK